MDGIDVTCTTLDGEAFLGAETLHRPAFSIMDVSPLLDALAAIRGENLLIPLVAGTKAMRKRVTETVYTCRMILDGRWSVDGDPVEDHYAGLRDVKDWLLTNVHLPPGGDSTRTLSVVKPSGSTVSGSVHTSLAYGARSGPIQRALLSVSVPAGRLS